MGDDLSTKVDGGHSLRTSAGLEKRTSLIGSDIIDSLVMRSHFSLWIYLLITRFFGVKEEVYL
jgi:hypothetical protein